MSGHSESECFSRYSGKILIFLLQGLQWADRNIFLFATLCFLLGIAAAHSPLIHLSRPFVSIAVLLLLFFLGVQSFTSGTSKKYFPLSQLFTLLLFFLLGSLALKHQLNMAQAHRHVTTLITERQPVTLVGTLTTMIEENVFQQDGQEEIVSRFELEVEEVLLHQGKGVQIWQPVHGCVRLSMEGRDDTLQPGLHLMVPAQVGPVTRFQTLGVFNYQEFLAAKDIFLTGWVIGDQVTILRKHKKNNVFFLPEKMRQKVSRFIRDNLPRPISGTYQALLVGSRAGVPSEIQEQFKATGTMHLLAISGLHMGLLALMAGTIILWLLKRSEQLLLWTHVPTLALVITLPLLLGYSFIAGMNIPVLRALVMSFVLFAAIILRRQHALPYVLAAAALLILTLNPLALFTASFQLSFSAVAALILFLPNILPSLSEKEEKALDAQRHWLVRLLKSFIQPALIVSLVATLGTLPFMLIHFHRFSLIGPVMNLVVEPFLCFWALTWGLLALPFIFVAPDIGIVLLKMGALGIQAAHYLTAIGAAFPWASVWTITPNSVEIFIYGLLLFLWSLFFRAPKFKKITQRVLLIILIIGTGILVLHFTWGRFFVKKSDFSTVSYLDVGQGTSSLLQLADGTRVLIDGGGNRKSRLNIGEQVIGPYLWKQRIWNLNQAIITHPHSDHFNGMDFILAHFKPKTLFINGDSRIEENYQDIIHQAEQSGIKVFVPHSEEIIVAHKNAEVIVYNGADNGGKLGMESVNDTSLVLKYRHGERAFLFPGDIGKKKERSLIRQQIQLSADILLAPHHGSSTSSSIAFMDAVAPQLIIVSAGKYGEKYYPAAKNLAAWTKRRIPVVITRDQGAIRCKTNGEQLSCFDFRGSVIYDSLTPFKERRL